MEIKHNRLNNVASRNGHGDKEEDNEDDDSSSLGVEARGIKASLRNVPPYVYIIVVSILSGTYVLVEFFQLVKELITVK